MPRWLAALLIALLSIQLTWAAVAPYCQHEAAPSGHFGHHEHHHHGAADSDVDDKQGAAKSPLTVDADCGQCHGVCAGLGTAAPTGLSPVPSDKPSMRAVTRAASGTVERPERPKWSALA